MSKRIESALQVLARTEEMCESNPQASIGDLRHQAEIQISKERGRRTGYSTIQAHLRDKGRASQVSIPRTINPLIEDWIINRVYAQLVL